ncbi:MAG: hypothetical protein ACI4J8_07810 [Oscillospiraceae bacterium]
MNFERPYYIDIGMRPMLFYIIFGVNDQNTVISRERHRVDAAPEGLEFQLLNREQHGDYIDSLLSSVYGEVLREKKPELFDRVKECSGWTILRGELAEDSSLDYLRNTIGFVQAFCENGGVGVLDLQTISLYSPEEWNDRFFSADFDPIEHTVFMVSRAENNLAFVHTRGMRKFGRPDIGIENIPWEEVDDAALVAEQMVRYGAMGAVFTDGAVFCISGGKRYSVNPEFVPDFDNDDYNNAFYKVDWTQCELTFEDK